MKSQRNFLKFIRIINEIKEVNEFQGNSNKELNEIMQDMKE
jgi:hypothetical protein